MEFLIRKRRFSLIWCVIMCHLFWVFPGRGCLFAQRFQICSSVIKWDNARVWGERRKKVLLLLSIYLSIYLSMCVSISIYLSRERERDRERERGEKRIYGMHTNTHMPAQTHRHTHRHTHTHTHTYIYIYIHMIKNDYHLTFFLTTVTGSFTHLKSKLNKNTIIRQDIIGGKLH